MAYRRTNSGLWVNKGLVGYWPLSGGNVQDISGAGNNGTVIGATSFGQRSFSFTGSNYIGTPASFASAPAISMSCWVYLTSFPNPYNGILSRYGTSTGDCDFYVTSAGKVAIYTNATGGSSFYDSAGSHTLVAGQWYHLAMTYDSVSGLAGYVNGQIDGTYTPQGTLIPAVGGSLIFTIGNAAQNQFPVRNFNGLMRSARVHNRALSAVEVAQLYANPRPTFGLAQPRRLIVRSAGGPTTTFIVVRALSALSSRAVPSPRALTTARAQAFVASRVALSATAPVAARAETVTVARAAPSVISSIAARALSAVTAHAAPGTSALVAVAGRILSALSARGTVSLASPLSARAEATTNARAAPSAVSAIAARTLSAVVPRAAVTAAAPLTTRVLTAVASHTATTLRAAISVRALSRTAARAAPAGRVAILGRALAKLSARATTFIASAIAIVLPARAAPTVRFVAAQPTIRFAIAKALVMTAIQPTPERLGAMRAGDPDTRGYDLTLLLVPLGITVASVTSITAVRRDGAPMTGNDLILTPSGQAAPWITGTGLIVNWWQSSINAADYQITIKITCTDGRTLTRDLYQLVTSSLG